MDSPMPDCSSDDALSSPESVTFILEGPATRRPEQQRRRSTRPLPSRPANPHHRRPNRTRTIRSAQRVRKRKPSLQRLAPAIKRLRSDPRLTKYLQKQAEAHHSIAQLPLYEELFSPDLFPAPRKPRIGDLPPGVLQRRALKYAHGLDAGAPVTAHPVITSAMAASLVSSLMLGTVRTSAISSAHAKNTVNVEARPVKETKSLMSGNGISCYFELAEPVVYLTGFDKDNRGIVPQNTSAILRGKLILDVQKSVKIKAVTVRFYGKSRTDWPEGESRLCDPFTSYSIRSRC